MPTKLDNFILENFSEYNQEHKWIKEEMLNDPVTRKYIGDIDRIIYKLNSVNKLESPLNEFLVIKYGEEDYGYNPCGIAFLETKYDDKGTPKIYISYSLLKKYRGKNLGKLFLYEFSEELFIMNPEIEELYVEIDPQNVASIKAANFVGYEANDEYNTYSMKR